LTPTYDDNTDIDGATMNFVDISDPAGQPLEAPAYVFAVYGTLSGAPTVVNGVPTGYHLNFAYGGNQIALVAVPEPGCVVLLLTALSIFALRRRR
jgi:hypothetical protein